MSAKHDLLINKGETFTRILTWSDSTGTLINLTGFSARMHIRENINDSAFIIELTNSNGGIVLGGALGTITITINDTVTSEITQDTGFYDIELVSGSGIVTRLMEGNVIFSPNITR